MLLHDKFSTKDLKKLRPTQLLQLADEIRERIISVVSNNGGHIAPSLGVVELTIALHYIYNSPKDKIIWDVGHQTYAHKILTGRNKEFETLRRYKGLSGFPKRRESEHDIFDVGHSSTSLSAAYGIATARDLNKENYKVIAVIGDGSMTNGMPFEAMNNIGHSQRDMLIILNDNEMSISKNVGALSKYFNKIYSSNAYNKMRDEIWNLLGKVEPLSKQARQIGKKLEEGIKFLLTSGIIFEEMGIRYFGPIDGHNFSELIDSLVNLNKIPGPKLLHIITKKGKGYFFAENNARKFHGMPPFKIETGEVEYKALPTFTKIFGEKILELAKSDAKICAITAAMPDGTGLTAFEKEIPQRFFDVGIAEEHAVTFAAGLATQGYKPYVAIYSTFLQRSFDQIIHDVALQNLPVRFIIDRAGLVGDDGATHQGIFDLSYLNIIPNMRILIPKDQIDLETMLTFSVNYETGPLAIRFPRGSIIPENKLYFKDVPYNSIQELIIGKKYLIIASGRLTYNAYEAISNMNNNGAQIGLIAVLELKPFNKKLLFEIIKRNKYDHIITIEENTIIGGLGSTINETILNFSEDIRNKIKVKNLGIPDKFIDEGDVYKDLFPELNLDVKGIEKTIEEFFKIKIKK